MAAPAGTCPAALPPASLDAVDEPGLKARPPMLTACRPATMSAELVWELVKNSNSFLRKSVHGAVFSAEPGNL